MDRILTYRTAKGYKDHLFLRCPQVPRGASIHEKWKDKDFTDPQFCSWCVEEWTRVYVDKEKP